MTSLADLDASRRSRGLITLCAALTADLLSPVSGSLAMCVLASRHRHARIVVARADVPELLDAHPSTEPVHLGAPAKFPDG